MHMFDHCIYFNTTALARALEREWTAAYKPFGLTPPQGFMLRAVLAKPGIVQSELAAELAISRSTATRTLDGLQKMTLIERRFTASDGRETALYPTDDALQIKDQLNAASAAVTRRLKAEMGEGCFSATVANVKEARSSID